MLTFVKIYCLGLFCKADMPTESAMVKASKNNEMKKEMKIYCGKI